MSMTLTGAMYKFISRFAGQRQPKINLYWFTTDIHTRDIMIRATNFAEALKILRVYNYKVTHIWRSVPVIDMRHISDIAKTENQYHTRTDIFQQNNYRAAIQQYHLRNLEDRL